MKRLKGDFYVCSEVRAWTIFLQSRLVTLFDMTCGQKNKNLHDIESHYSHPLAHRELLPLAECKCSSLVIYSFISCYLFIIANYILWNSDNEQKQQMGMKGD